METESVHQVQELTGKVVIRFLQLSTNQNAQYSQVVVVVFPQAPFRVTNVPGQASAGIIQLRNCTMAFLRIAVGDLVTPFVLESCLIIHVLLNLQVHTWGMSLASSGKFV